MNQTQRLIDSIRDAPHDAVIVAGMFAIPGSDRTVDRQPYAAPGARLGASTVRSLCWPVRACIHAARPWRTCGSRSS